MNQVETRSEEIQWEAARERKAKEAILIAHGRSAISPGISHGTPLKGVWAICRQMFMGDQAKSNLQRVGGASKGQWQGLCCLC